MFGRKVHNEVITSPGMRSPIRMGASQRASQKKGSVRGFKVNFGFLKSRLRMNRRRNRSNDGKRKRDFNEVEGKLEDSVKNALRESAERARERVFRRSSTRIKLLFTPDGGVRACWDGIFMIGLCYALFEVPYAVVFLESSCDWTWRETVNVSCDCIFLFDILVNFNTAYFDENAILVVDHWKIAGQYMKTWFFIDLLSSLPLDRIVCGSVDGAGDNAGALRLFKILRIVKMVRLIRFMRVIKKWEMFVGSGVLTKSIKLFKLATVLIFCAHVCGCLWMALLPWVDCRTSAADLQPGAVSAPCNCEGEGCVVWNWLERYDPNLSRKGTAESKYLACVYFSIVTLSTVGYGDILPTNDVERLFAILLALMGAVVFALCIGSIANLATEGNQSENIVEEKIREVLDFLTFVKVPRRLQHRAQRQLLHASAKAPHHFHRWLEHAPLYIRQQVVTQLAIDDTEKVPFLSAMDFDCKAKLAALFYPCLLRPGEVLFKALDTTAEMYFVVRGQLEVLELEGPRVIEKVGIGDMIGEGSMFDDSVPFSYTTVKARVECELLGLSREDFLQYVKPAFPDLYTAVKELHEERSKYLNKTRMVEVMSRRSAARCGGFVQQLNTIRVAMREVTKAAKTDPTLVARPMKQIQVRDGVKGHGRAQRGSWLSVASVARASGFGSPQGSVSSEELGRRLSSSVSTRMPMGRSGSDPMKTTDDPWSRTSSGERLERPASAGAWQRTVSSPLPSSTRPDASEPTTSSGRPGRFATKRSRGKCPVRAVLDKEVQRVRETLNARMDRVEEGIRAMTKALESLPSDELNQELTEPVWWSVTPYSVASRHLTV